MAPALLLWCLAAAPLAEVWPYQARRLPGGAIEYAYDLTPIKQQGGNPDANAAWGEPKVREFLKGLPRETKVELKGGTSLFLAGGRGLEPVPLFSSLGSINEGPLRVDDPLERPPRSQLRAPLHPEEPKLLLSAEAVLWRARRLIEGAQAAMVLDNERLHAVLWSKLADRALARMKTVNGDAKEGAAVLAGRLFAVGTCLDSSRVPASARTNSEVNEAVEAELALARSDVDLAVPVGWTRELACSRVRARMLGRPFPHSRAGAAAALTLLGLLLADPKLQSTWETLRSRRDALELGPAKEGLLDYRERTSGKVDEALENMAAFIDALGETLPPVPPPFESSSTSFGRFLSELEGAAKVSAPQELLSAAQDDRLAFPSTEMGAVMSRFESAIARLVAEDAKGPQLDAAWRDRRAAGFAALSGTHHDHAVSGTELPESVDERSELKVRLMLPPSIEVEPAGAAYAGAADALERLAAATAKLNLGSLLALQPEGGRGAEPIATEAKRMASMLRGLARLSSGDPGGGVDKDVAEARRFLGGWRSDGSFTRDVREVRALPINQGSQRAHVALVGVARRELVVGFVGTPKSEPGTAGAFEVAPAEQRYLIPALVTRSALAPAAAAPIDRAALRALCESAKRQPNEIEAAFIDAMKAR
jgi:hypothetical protein